MSSLQPTRGEDEIFADALEIPPADRAGYLDRACGGDPGLRERVDSLLAGYEQAAGFLEAPIFPRLVVGNEEATGDRIGPYTLLDRIGEGGCGVVFRAEQTHPVRRRVALKVIKLGMDTRQVIARFEAERQTLALMDHPGIARVLDAGSTDAGRPFFVMEFVEGVPVTRFCDERRLPLAARLELFAQVCLAIQHAHQKGIIHRDVKPSNILVAEHDGVPAPKVIDFGIAKATQGRLTDTTQLTQVDQLVGTPAYMSPEQAEAASDDIDTRSDIYSLGVLLYELLVGRPPFDSAGNGRTAIDAMRRLVREVDPPRPSARFGYFDGAARADTAARRSVRPAQLAAALRGDLDWIVMRCLAKERSRRYDTAQALADDIRRHLRQEPVLARPPELAYRVRKFIARNRLACASAAAVALAVVAGVAVSVGQAVRATRAERAAVVERDAARAAQAAEALARGDAQRRQEQAEDVFGFMIGDFRGELKKVGRLDLLDAVGARALAYFDSLDPRDLTDAGLARQAKVLTQIGEIRLDQARYDDAAKAFQTAYDRAAALAARRPRDADALFERAQAEYWIGFTARRRGDAATERAWLVRYRDSALALAAIDPDPLRAQREVTSGHHNLAVLEFDRGNLASAREGFLTERRSVEAMLKSRPDDLNLKFRLADIASWLGAAAERGGDYSEAIERFGEMSARIEELVAVEPGNARWQTKLADASGFAANVLALAGRTAEALQAYDKALAIYSPLIAQDPNNRQWLLVLLTMQLQKAIIQVSRKGAEPARQVIREIRHRMEALLSEEPMSRSIRRQVAIALQADTRVLADDDQAAAKAAITAALKIGESLLTEAGADNRTVGDLAQSLVLAGRIAASAGAMDDARQHWSRAVSLLATYYPDSHDWRYLDPASQALVLLGRRDEALPPINRLKSFGYQPIDHFAASILETAP